jgi:hypothetical protein
MLRVSRILPLVQLSLQVWQFDLTFSLRQRTVPTFHIQNLFLLVLGSDTQRSKWTHVDPPPRRVTSSHNKSHTVCKNNKRAVLYSGS